MGWVSDRFKMRLFFFTTVAVLAAASTAFGARKRPITTTTTTLPTVTTTTLQVSAPASYSVTVLAASSSMIKENGGAWVFDGLNSHMLWSNGKMYTDLQIPASGTYTLRVKADGTSAGGILPKMDVLVDGAWKMQFDVRVGSYSDYSVNVYLAAGTRRIDIAFVNDGAYGTEDRNLVIHSLTVESGGSVSTPTSTTTTTTLAPTTTTTLPASTVQTGVFNIRSRINQAYCADLDIEVAYNGSRVYIWQCVSGLANQAFTFTAEREIKVHGKCLTSGNYGGAQLYVQDCNGSATQKFAYESSTGLIKGANNLCIDVYGGQMVNRNYLNMYGCDANNMNMKFALTATTAPIPTQPIPTEPAPTQPAPGTNPLAGAKFFINPWTGAYQNQSYCSQMPKLAATSMAIWMAGGTSDSIARDLGYLLGEADKQGGAVATIVVYNIPNRDCGLYSAGGASASAYGSFINSIAQAIGSRKAIIVLEPDAIAGAGCLSGTAYEERFTLIRNAVSTFRSVSPNALVYLDAGNPHWSSPGELAPLLKKAGIDNAQGFALNVSNFITTQENVTFGTQISNLVGGKHFVIDTSRNGNGPYTGSGVDENWCNPPGRAVGLKAQGLSSGLVDAYIWVKPPGDSDGQCRSGSWPSAGTFMPQYACDMAARAGW